MKMTAPENCGGLSTPDGSFEVDDDGMVDVPAAYVEVAKSHGFTVYVEAPAKKGGKKEPAKSEQSDASAGGAGNGAGA